ncbi:hypothetical protein MAR_030438, partial [Mya arenaria]
VDGGGYTGDIPLVYVHYRLTDVSLHKCTYYNVSLLQVRDIGKCVRHAPGLNISDWDLKLWLSDLKTLFADPIFNKNNPLAQDAIDQLDMLERDELLIQHSDIAEVLDIKNAFEELSSGLDKRASDIGDVVDDIIAPVKHDATDRAIQDTRELIEWKQDAIDDFNVITVEEALTKEPYYIIRFAVQFAQRDQADVKQQAITKKAGTMTQFMKKDVGTMTEHRDDTSSAGSGKTDLSEPSVDFGKNDIHDEGAKRLTKDAVHESDDISPRDSVETYLSELSVDVGVDIHEEGAKRLSKHEVDESGTNIDYLPCTRSNTQY